jgi:GntR family transcriptional regulator
VRSLSYTPVAVEEVWLDTRFGTLTREDLSESLYKSYSERLNLTITHAEDRLSVAPLPHWAAPHLGLAPKHPMGLVKRRSFNQYGEPAEASITWYDPALAQYYARVP